MARHVHIAGLTFGPPHIHTPSGHRPSEPATVPYEEIVLVGDGTVMFKRNLPQPDGLNNAAQWPVGANVPTVRW